MGDATNTTGSETTTPPTLLPPADVLLRAFQGRAFLTARTMEPWRDVLLSAAHMTVVHKQIHQAKKQLRNKKLSDRERLDGAIRVDEAERDLEKLVAKVDGWLERQTLPEQDEDILDGAEPFVFSLGEVISKMAELVSTFGDDFMYVVGMSHESPDHIHWAEMTWAYKGHCEDVLTGRRYASVRRRQ